MWLLGGLSCLLAMQSYVLNSTPGTAYAHRSSIRYTIRVNVDHNAQPINPVCMLNPQVATLIFLAEWGDRSMVATIALGAAKSPGGEHFFYARFDYHHLACDITCFLPKTGWRHSFMIKGNLVTQQLYILIPQKRRNKCTVIMRTVSVLIAQLAYVCQLHCQVPYAARE